MLHHANPIPPGHQSKGGENDVEAPGNLKFCYFYCFGHLNKFQPAIKKSLNGKAGNRETLNKHISVDVYISLLSSPGTWDTITTTGGVISSLSYYIENTEISVT